MLITCPTCASAYRIDLDKVGADGRSVRCAACRETWFITPADVLAARAAEAADAEPSEAAIPDPVSDAAWSEAAAAVRPAQEDGAAEPPPPVARRPPAARARKAGGRVRGLSPALGLGLAALAALPLACLARASVVQVLPRTAALYARIGLPVNLRGLEIRDVAAYRNPAADGRPAELIVEGDLAGVGRADASVPALTVEVRDGAGAVLHAFTAAPPRAVLGPGETARFRASLTDPPTQGRAVEVRFAEGKTPAADRAGTARH